MSVVIIGGNECMERQYQQICKKHGCKAKVFVKEKSGFSLTSVLETYLSESRAC